jgi:hypothetical protein
MNREAIRQASIATSKQSAGLLAAITVHKVLRQVEHHSQQKRSMEREESLHALDSLPVPAEFVARDPSPEEAVAMIEAHETAAGFLETPATIDPLDVARGKRAFPQPAPPHPLHTKRERVLPPSPAACGPDSLFPVPFYKPAANGTEVPPPA